MARWAALALLFTLPACSSFIEARQAHERLERSRRELADLRQQQYARFRAQQQADQQVSLQEQTDEFTGARTVVLSTYAVTWERGRFPRTSFLLTVDPATAQGHLTITTSGERWRWLECHSFHMLINDHRINLRNEGQHGGDAVRGGVVEQVSVDLPPGIVRTLHNVRRFRARICNDVFTVSPATIQALQRVPGMLDPVPPPLPASAR